MVCSSRSLDGQNRVNKTSTSVTMDEVKGSFYYFYYGITNVPSLLKDFVSLSNSPYLPPGISLFTVNCSG